MKFEKFEIGTKFVILSKPSKWSSKLCDNSPFCYNIEYPYQGIIIDKSPGNDHIAITDGIYGWSLTCLLNEKKIVNLQEYRKIKLEKLQNYGKD